MVAGWLYVPTTHDTWAAPAPWSKSWYDETVSYSYGDQKYQDPSYSYS